ncbi:MULTISPECIES: hypothetical protein [Streptomyces]|uniref:hypothetical protein n=1 Tax=Streptomyces TaxID=1883 RepID=UPI00194E5F9A|nr:MULTISPECIES: hypothetical protein [Streptomyces]
MSGETGEARTGSGRAGAVGRVLAVLAGSAVAGFLAGAFLAGDGADAGRGGILSGLVVLLSAVAVALSLWRTRRRAAKYGLDTFRYLAIGRRIRRGEVPEDPAELPAAIDLVTRARRSSHRQDSRPVWWLMGGVALLWLVGAVMHALDGNYGRVGYNLALAGLFLLGPFRVRRQRRRLDAAEQALRERGHLPEASDGSEVPPGGAPVDAARASGGTRR